jgi:hypothetical protein
VVEQVIRRIRIHQELRELHKDVDIVADIKKKELDWIGHVVRMYQGRVDKIVFEGKPEGRRGTRWRSSLIYCATSR